MILTFGKDFVKFVKINSIFDNLRRPKCKNHSHTKVKDIYKTQKYSKIVNIRMDYDEKKIKLHYVKSCVAQVFVSICAVS